MNTRKAAAQPGQSGFPVQETIAYFRRKWLREHAVMLAFQLIAALVSLYFAAAAGGLWLAAVILAAFIWFCWTRNQMMIYVEKHAFPLPGEDGRRTYKHTDGGTGQ